jgi:hypothetical protein
VFSAVEGRKLIMKRELLQYSIHDGSAAMRFELAGSLSGNGAQSVRYAWQTALSVIGDRPLVFDITRVIDADDDGRSLLLRWQQDGAKIIAESRESRALAEAVFNELHAGR